MSQFSVTVKAVIVKNYSIDAETPEEAAEMARMQFNDDYESGNVPGYDEQVQSITSL